MIRINSLRGRFVRVVFWLLRLEWHPSFSVGCEKDDGTWVEVHFMDVKAR